MDKKISEFTERYDSLSDDAYIPIIDTENEEFQNFKIKIKNFFYKIDEIERLLMEKGFLTDDSLANLNTDIINLNTKITNLKNQIGSLNVEITNLKSQIGNLNSEIGKKQDKNIGNSNKVIISGSDSNIKTSDITVDELNYLDGLTINIKDKFDNLDKSISDLNASKLCYYPDYSKAQILWNEEDKITDAQQNINQNGYIVIITNGNERYFNGAILQNNKEFAIKQGGKFSGYHERAISIWPIIKGSTLKRYKEGSGKHIVYFIPIA